MHTHGLHMAAAATEREHSRTHAPMDCTFTAVPLIFGLILLICRYWTARGVLQLLSKETEGELSCLSPRAQADEQLKEWHHHDEAAKNQGLLWHAQETAKR